MNELLQECGLALAAFKSEMSYWNKTNPCEYNERRFKEVSNQVEGLLARISKELEPKPEPLIVVPSVSVNPEALKKTI